MDVSGRDLVTGLPHTITLNSEETELAMRESLQDVVRACRTVLEQTPPELSADIVSQMCIRDSTLAAIFNICLNPGILLKRYNIHKEERIMPKISRREFIKGTALAGVSLAASSLLSACAASPQTDVYKRQRKDTADERRNDDPHGRRR